MSWFSPQMKAALLRGLGVALSAFVLSFLVALSQGASVELALAAAIAAALGALGIRTGAEGVYDTRRAIVGDVKASDVGAPR